MSIESFSPLAGAAGTPLALVYGAELERARHDAAAHLRRVAGDAKAAGIAAPDGDDNRIDDREADGRRAWELPARTAADDNATAISTAHDCQARDAAIGRGLDLTA